MILIWLGSFLMLLISGLSVFYFYQKALSLWSKGLTDRGQDFWYFFPRVIFFQVTRQAPLTTSSDRLNYLSWATLPLQSLWPLLMSCLLIRWSGYVFISYSVVGFILLFVLLQFFKSGALALPLLLRVFGCLLGLSMFLVSGELLARQYSVVLADEYWRDFIYYLSDGRLLMVVTLISVSFIFSLGLSQSLNQFSEFSNRTSQSFDGWSAWLSAVTLATGLISLKGALALWLGEQLFLVFRNHQSSVFVLKCHQRSLMSVAALLTGFIIADYFRAINLVPSLISEFGFDVFDSDKRASFIGLSAVISGAQFIGTMTFGHFASITSTKEKV